MCGSRSVCTNAELIRIITTVTVKPRKFELLYFQIYSLIQKLDSVIWPCSCSISKRNVSFMRPKLMFDIKKKADNNHFWGQYIFMSTSLYFEILIILNKTSSPETSFVTVK